MKKKIYLGEDSGEWELERAWLEVYDQVLTAEKRTFYLQQPRGSICLIGYNQHRQPVYWVALGQSKSICKQAWADLWPLLDDSIVNWEYAEKKAENVEKTVR